MSDFNFQNERYSQPQAWQPQSQSGRTALTAAEVSLSERLSFIRKVYALFSIGILFAIGGVLIGFSLPALMVGVVQHYWIGLIAMFGSVMIGQGGGHVRGGNPLALF